MSLSRPEIRDDLLSIQQAIAREFSSTYFEETAVSSASVHEPPAVELVTPKQPTLKNTHHRLARRSTLSAIQAPTSEAQERRQLKAAIKASQLELERAA